MISRKLQTLLSLSMLTNLVFSAGFNRCSFHLGKISTGADGQNVQHATVLVDGQLLAGWHFYIQV